MAHAYNTNPLPVAHLFPLLDAALMRLLRSLSPEEWNAPTLAKQWTVKDIAAHLLDGNIRTLSMQRDRYFGLQPSYPLDSYEKLVHWINTLNNDWVQAARRMSPDVVMLLLEQTNPLTSAYYATLQPFEEAIFSVAWAGEETSLNWMHLAREYTEKWHHQQQIREAVGGRTESSIMTRELFYPLIATFLQGLPHTYRFTSAPEGTRIAITITSELGGIWFLERLNSAWILAEQATTQLPRDTAASITLPPDTAWKLFCKGISPTEARTTVQFAGDEKLGEVSLGLVSVMA
ncbi:MAG: maleylpyruvate isomerase family mycothiol-dependent enzyme [Candidatus Kapaibacterium sp.]|nr:MAG: maleylpyruvate isomerase family mycothiol-dependent enzyme [Candidatus Kapabacteria bacterium]